MKRCEPQCYYTLPSSSSQPVRDNGEGDPERRNGGPFSLENAAHRLDR